MNEEEKKAVERFKRLYLKDFNNEKITNEDRLSYIECVLISNLIEKLQKENEELNLKYYMLYTEKIENLKAQEVKIKSQVIPLQKVKDKIRHYQELQDNYIKKYDETNESLQAMINVLQELLEGRK